MGCINSSVKQNQTMSKTLFLKEKKGDVTQDYDIGRKLGEGTFGEVRLVRNKITGDERACKFIRKDRLEQEELDNLINEMNVLGNMDHPNIIQLFECFSDKKHYSLVTEICKGGELFEQIEKKNQYTEEDTQALIKRLLTVICYCHSKGIVHRDLKPQNILLEADMDVNKMKLADFGTAGPYDKSGKKKMSELVGTPYYVAPEVLQSKYGEKCDIWSIGVITFLLLSGKLPFTSNSIQGIFNKIEHTQPKYSGSGWDNVSSGAAEFVQALLIKDPKKRLSAADALKHSWITSAPPSTRDHQQAKSIVANLKTFRAHEVLKQATYSYMASQLVSKKDREQMSIMFRTEDKNGDGVLQKPELVKIFENMGYILTTKEMDELFAHMDIDKSGCIAYSEFIAAAVNTQTLLTDQKLRNAFEMFDKDGDHSIEAHEIHDILEGATDVSIAEIIKQVDTNLDGKISFDEFKTMMKNSAEQRE